MHSFVRCVAASLCSAAGAIDTSSWSPAGRWRDVPSASSAHERFGHVAMSVTSISRPVVQLAVSILACISVLSSHPCAVLVTLLVLLAVF